MKGKMEKNLIYGNFKAKGKKERKKEGRKEGVQEKSKRKGIKISSRKTTRT